MTPNIFTGDSARTFAEFEQDTLRVAMVLRAEGVRPGDRVLLKAGNSAAWLNAFFALMHVGASIVLVDQQEHARETARIVERTRARLCLYDDDAPMPAETPDAVYLYKLLVEASGLVPTEPAFDFDAWCALPDGLIMWSSGSTGTPKGVVKNGGRFLENLRRNADHMGHGPGDVLLPLLPFAHQYGLSMVLIAWLAECSLVVAPHRRLDRSLLMGGQCGVTVIDATPATYRSMLNLARSKADVRAALGGVRMFCSGAAPLDPALSDAYVDAFGQPLLDSYGSTELGNIAFATIDNPVACGQVMKGLEMTVQDDDGNVLAAGEMGELVVNTPDMMAGYLAEDGRLDPVEQGWYRTGDLGHLDADGNLFVAGRKLAVHRMGYTLYPEIIERRAAVAGCTVKVIALPDDARGAELVFFVEDPTGQDVTEWRRRIKDALPSYEHPNRVVVIDSFPLNRNGKPDRRALEQRAAERSTAELAASV
ncbi:Long-chain-fatty-acid--CoA ligase [Streptomyces sp. YIM 121038]|uniref:class I adenylate-forming enzyme family protein n=1 Tax=Streptomyces sp. YIM 121038 TaxID=2136401 RepID=UPI0011102CC9|nr:class I adenylate-forming enzyme family protein [Streptomyces sp. YIM 121038]QCX80418.1 Long-chain-fatty-acid--CoA ligase [Streptomyces sp. YIM 121038]